METVIKLGLATLLGLLIYERLSRRGQNIWLLLLSYGLYATWAWQFAISLTGLTLANYALARRIQKSRPNRGWLIAGIGLNIGILVWFKYANFFLSLPVPFGLASPVLAVVLPIGLSFLILQTISYLVDVYQGVLEPDESLLDFALYLAYFPKLTAGPIERAKSFLPQIAVARQVSSQMQWQSLLLILVGILRKLVIADTLYALIPPGAFAHPASQPAPVLWSALLAFGFALYNDFAGYSNIALGISGLFGIRLTPNFDYPYFAQTFGEFWSRWHISFSNWLRDYIYFPLARVLRQRYRNPSHALNIIVPPLVTMLISGLWHNATLPLLIWGAMHAFYQIGERLILLRFPRKPTQQRSPVGSAAAMLLVFLLVTLAWVPFYANNTAVLPFLRGLWVWGEWDIPDLRIFVLIALAIGLDVLLSRHRSDTAIMVWPRPVRIAFVTFICISAYLVIEAGAGVARTFVYQGF